MTNIGDWEEIGRDYSEYFNHICPTATMVEVSRLIDPQILVEIEVDAVSPQILRTYPKSPAAL